MTNHRRNHHTQHQAHSPHVAQARTRKEEVSEKSITSTYLDVLRRQPEHMQHIYAILFAGGITILLAAILLYSEYGFWHERYQRTEVIAETLSESQETIASKSPLDMAAIFFKDAKDQLAKVKTSSQGLLDGKEVYIQE